MQNEIFWKNLEESLPVVFPRKAVSKLTAGFISSGTLANLDSQKKGPPVKVRMGKFVGYEKESFIAWLKGR